MWDTRYAGTAVARIDCACAQCAREGSSRRQGTVIAAIAWMTARGALPVVIPAADQRTTRTPSPLGTVSW